MAEGCRGDEPAAQPKDLPDPAPQRHSADADDDSEDALQVLGERGADPQCAFFLDPPYGAPGKGAGRRLYRHWQLDHDRLFALAARLQGPWLMTYDRCPAVQALVHRHGLDCEPVAMRTAHNTAMNELVISRDLTAFREARRARLERRDVARAQTKPPARRRQTTGQGRT